MKILAITLILSFNTYAGEGGHGGGPRLSGNIQMALNRSPQGPGGTGGGPINLNDSQFIDKIDNIEISNEIKFPENFNEKIELLKKFEVQSIQLNNGQIISY
tara:strand:- start:136 stop:441 length:306 start_codon:yes stop_codon:yes gene_type:complete